MPNWKSSLFVSCFFFLFQPQSFKSNFHNITQCVFVFIVAKRKSLFDDKAVEIEELTYIIKQVSCTGDIPGSLQAICKMKQTNFGPVCVLQDINSLNKQIAQLQDLVRSRGTPSGRHIQTHSNTIVVSLQVVNKSSVSYYLFA